MEDKNETKRLDSEVVQKSRPGALSVAPGREPLGKSRAWAPHFSRLGASFSQKVAPGRPFFTPGRDQHTKLAPGHFSVQKLALVQSRLGAPQPGGAWA
ncbi:hypothetical protein VIGAN_03179800 [Vigna angularis var. angularis]|uniref:Uncharacterized protein n=1 Tax=Vigna angularis var. angularis TaxID=157739 RepID=A0A0S3RMS2_PHAAN|nr:hypothetical protein VIGAN_03179800 [Vigna angularis var. angularis]